MEDTYKNKYTMNMDTACKMNSEGGHGFQERYVSFPRLASSDRPDTKNGEYSGHVPDDVCESRRRHICSTVDQDKTEELDRRPSALTKGPFQERSPEIQEINGKYVAPDDMFCTEGRLEGRLHTDQTSDCDIKQTQGQADKHNGDSNGKVKHSQRAPNPLPTLDASPPDGGWGWVVCFTCLWVNGTVMGTANTFGILYNHMRDLYAQGDDEVSLKTSFVGSCMNGVMFFMSCVSGILCDVIGLRHTAVLGGLFCMLGFFSSAFVSQLELLYLTYGVLLGSGFGLVFSPMVAITGHYFKNNLGMVNGIVTFGASAFTVAMSFALPYLLKYFGLKATMLGYSGLGLTMTLCTLAWKPLISREYAHDDAENGGKVKHCLRFVTRKVLNGRVWKNRKFLCWSLAMSVSRFGYLEPYFHLVSHVSSILPGSNASILITILAAVSGISKLIVGKLSDFIRQYRIYLQQGALVVYGAVVICIPFSTTISGFVVIAVMLGLADAVIMVLFGPNAIELVGPGNAAQAVGFASLLAIPTFLSAPVITGTMHDHLKTYNLGFHVTGAITLLSSILMCLVTNPFQKQIPSTPPLPASTGDITRSPNQKDDPDYTSTSNYNHQSAFVNPAYEFNETTGNVSMETRL